MAAPGTIAATAASSTVAIWRTEIVETLKLALPMALTQLGQIAMMTTDLALIGRLGDFAVAAVALAQLILFAGFVVGMGLVSAVAPLAAQAFGARQPRLVRRSLRMGLWAALIVGIPINLAQLGGEKILIAAGQTPDAAALAARYLTGLTWSMIPAWWFIAIRNFMGAVNRPEAGLWVTLAAIPINAVLAFALINGRFGLPHLDLLGAGIATTLVNISMCGAGLWICYAIRPFRKYRVLGNFWRADANLLRRIFIIGMPISGSMMLEWGLFSSAAILVGWIGTAALAAHQVALQIATILFMIPLGISLAATVRVGHAIGRGDRDASRRSGFAAIGLGAAVMAIITVAIAALRDLIPLLFLYGNVQTAASVDLAATLLLVGTSFFIMDSVQGIAAGALRGLNDTRIPLLFAAISFWLIGFPASYLLAFRTGLGAVGVWIGFSIGLTVFATLLVWRFHLLTRPASHDRAH